MLGPTLAGLVIMLATAEVKVGATPAAAAASAGPNSLSTAGDVAAELERLAREARAWKPPPQTQFTFEEVGDYVPDAAALAAWRREVEGKPFHPRRADIERAERRLRHGPDTGLVRLAWAGPSRWRTTTDRPHLAGGAFLDTAENMSEAWQLHPTSLQVVAGDGAGDVRQTMRNNLESALSDIRILCSYGASVLPDPDAVHARPDVRMEGPTWNAGWDLTTPSGSWHVVSGGVLSDAAVIGGQQGHAILLIETVTMTPIGPDAVSREQTLTLSEFRWDHTLDRPVAGRFRWDHGRHEYTHRRLVAIESLPPTETERLIRVPTLQRGDAIRDLDQLKTLQFHDRGGMTASDVLRSVEGEATLVERYRALRPTPQDGHSPTLRWTSIGTAVAIVGLLVIRRWKRGGVAA